MPKFKVTHTSGKRTEEAECQNFQELLNWIQKIFNVQKSQIKFQKPRIKDQATFQQHAKDGAQITFVGQIRKQKTKEQKEKQKIRMKQIQKLKKQMDEQRIKHKLIVEKLQQLGIHQRGIQYFDQRQQRAKDTGMQFALCQLHILNKVPQLVKFCKHFTNNKSNYESSEDFIQDLNKIFVQLNKGKKLKKREKNQITFQNQNDIPYAGVVCPHQWLTAWICHCALVQYQWYKTDLIFDLDFVINKTFESLRNAIYQKEYQQQSDITFRTNDVIYKCFGIEVLTNRIKLTQTDQKDKLYNKSVSRRVLKFILQCDLSSNKFHNLNQGIKQRFKPKKLWQNVYAQDIQYSEQIIQIQKLPKYLLIHANRFGYMQAKQVYQRPELSQNKKSYHSVRISRIIDLYNQCNKSLKQKLNEGIHQRWNMFYRYDTDPKFPQFKKTIKNFQEIGDIQVRYMYFDHILNKKKIFHQFNFEAPQETGTKPTGEYRLTGIIYHKGDYYHHKDECKNINHKNKLDCIGDFMTIVYDRGTRWLKFHHANVQETTIQQATDNKYWGKQGQRQWTPVLFMYHQIKMKNLQFKSKQQMQKQTQKARKKRQIQQMQRQQRQLINQLN